MRTKKHKPLAPEAPSADSEPVVPSIPSEPTEPKAETEKLNRISFFVSNEGTPEWNRIAPQTKARLAAILQNPQVQKELGFTKEEAKEISELGFGEDEANTILDLLGTADSFAASLIYKVPADICSQAFSFSPDHRKKINPPLQRVLNKWAPAVLKTWKDEIGLAMILFATLNAQIRVMHMLDERRKKNIPRPVTPITPITEAPKPAEPAIPKEEKEQESIEAS
jgi:hypothetical protein